MQALPVVLLMTDEAALNQGKEVKPKTFFLLLQVGGHQVVKEHDELRVHGDADVVGELGHHAALHDGLAAGVWNKTPASPRVFE